MALLVVVTTVFGNVDYQVQAETTTSYTKVTSVDQFTTGSYVMVLNTGYAPLQFETIGTANWVTVVQPTLNENQLVNANGAVWTLTVDGNNVQIKDKNSTFIKPKAGNSNGIYSGEYNWAWSFDSTKGVFVFKGQNADTTILASDINSDNMIRAYEVDTVAKSPNGYYSEFTLYKVEGETQDSSNPSGSSSQPVPKDPSQDNVVISTISEALAGANGTSFSVKGVVTLIDGKNIYLQDATGGICVYLNSKATGIEVGDTVVGKGERADYKGMPQLSPGTYEKSEGLTLTAKKTAIKELTKADLGTYVELSNLEVVSIGTGDTPTVTLKDETASIEIYRAIVGKTDGTNWDIKVGDKVNVKAAVGIYNEKLQLRNTLASEITVAEPARTFDTIAQALAGVDGAEFTVKGVVTLVDGQNIYLQDATGGICVRMTSKPSDISLGDTIIGSGKKTVYNQLPQLATATYEKSTGLKLNAKKKSIGELSATDVCTYVKISGVVVTEIYDNNGKYSNPNVTLTDGTNTIQIYKAVVGKSDGSNWDIRVGQKVDVKAAVGTNNGKLQLRNTNIGDYKSC